jgi:protein ImuB
MTHAAASVTPPLLVAGAEPGARGAAVASARRVLAVWCPDWPVVTALAERVAEPPGRPSGTLTERSPGAYTERSPGGSVPAAVFSANVIQSCNAAARACGVRRGMRRRDAQARCPELAVLPANLERDARAFEEVLVALEHLSPGVAPLRPGLVALYSPGRYYGGESEAGAVLAERLVELGVWDCRFGVADDLFTAIQAARRADQQNSLVIPAGAAPAFLRELPMHVIDDADAVSLLGRLGVRTLGQLADLPAPDVLARFGSRVAWVHRIVSGNGAEMLATRTPPPELRVQVDFEPPLDSAETICFSSRRTADRFVELLTGHGLVCTAARVEVECDGRVVSARTWLHPRWFEPADLVDRLHWQLQGSLRAGEVRSPVDRVRFVPEAVASTAVRADGLWGNTDERVERGIARVQGLLGHEAVVRPVRQGGRAPADRQAFVPWGERPVGLRPLDRPWPGRLPAPAPTRVFTPPWPATVTGVSGCLVTIDDRGVMSEEPASFRVWAEARDQGGHPVAAWAGPWPVDELWWEQPARRVARIQVVGVDGRAWLMTYDDGHWWTEAGYD